MHESGALHSDASALPHAVPSGCSSHSSAVPLPLPVPPVHVPSMHRSPAGHTSPGPHGAPAEGSGAKHAPLANASTSVHLSPTRSAYPMRAIADALGDRRSARWLIDDEATRNQHHDSKATQWGEAARARSRSRLPDTDTHAMRLRNRCNSRYASNKTARANSANSSSALIRRNLGVPVALPDS